MGKFKGRDIKLVKKDTKLSKCFSNKKFGSIDGKGLTLTNGLYFILAFVSAIRFP